MNIKRYYGIDGFTWQRICTFYDNKCLSCGEKSTPESLTVDHVRPVSMGGSNTVRNYQPLCMVCNREKKNTIIDYRWDKGKALLSYLTGGPLIEQPSLFEKNGEVKAEMLETLNTATTVTESIIDEVASRISIDFHPLAEALTILADNQTVLYTTISQLTERIESLERFFTSPNKNFN